MFLIRADANKEIGSGHIMRCLSIASALKACGEKVLFIVADEGAEVLLNAGEQDFYILHTDYRDMEAELDVLLPVLNKMQPGLLLMDSYFVTKRYLTQVRKYVKTAYIDDIPRFSYPVDMLINYNIYGDCLPYSGESRFLLGASYAPLRPQFLQVGYEVRPEVEDVLITTGGSDKYNLAGQILEAVLERKETASLHYHVVSGAFNPNLAALEALSEGRENISLYKNVTDMAGLMKKMDIAVTAGGSTMYELCAVGVPALCFSFVDNQELIVETFRGKQLVHYGGNYLKEQDAFAGNVAEALAELAGSADLRKNYSKKQRLLVDGCGASRIAEAIRGLAAGIKHK